MRRGTGQWRALLAIGLVAATLVAVAPSAATAREAPPPTAAVLRGSGCAGPLVPGSYVGSLIVQGGGASAPTPGGRTVNVSYYYELNYTPSGGGSTYSCLSGSASATTNSFGGFSITLPVTASSCSGSSCSLYSGPYAPLAFALGGGAPAGYYLTSAVSGSTMALALVAALDHVDLAPSSRVTLSTQAPTVVTATARAGNGAASPAALTYAWQLVGGGWTLLNGSTGPAVTILADDSAVPGTLTVWVNGSYANASVRAPAVTLEIQAAPTTVTTASVVPTLVDVGTLVTFTVVGTGAGGYNYSATVDPGLTASPVVAPCTGAILEGGRLTLTCAVSTTYPTPGTATPSATLSNGFSSAPATFLALPVAAALATSVNPSPLLLYVGVTGTITVAAAAGTGTLPYGPACVWPGDGRVVCRSGGAGASIPVPVSYAYPGTYAARASLADAGGANETVALTASVFSRPSLATIAPVTAGEVGRAVDLASTFSGGALPATYWWNTTTSDGTPTGTIFEGTLAADGAVLLHFTPVVSGTTWITLAVRDALGTTLVNQTFVRAFPGPFAGLIDRTTTGNGTAVAGTPIALSLEAVDALGEPIATAAPALTLTVAPPSARAAPAWLNGSAGAVAGTFETLPAGPGPTAGWVFSVAASDWHDGWLNASLTLGASGAWSLGFPAGLNVSDAPGGARALTVAPDPWHLRLLGDVSAPPTARSFALNLSVSDRWGDALDGGYLLVTELFGGVNTTSAVAVKTYTIGGVAASFAFVRFAAPSASAGTLALFDPAWEPLHEPLAIPGAQGPIAPVVYVGLATAAGLGTLGVLVLFQGRSSRRRRPDAPGGAAAEATEAELRRMAQGRAHILARADPTEGRTLDELVAGFDGPPPRPEEVTDWVASLVAEGSLRTALGEDGRSRFLRTAEPAPPPSVELDDQALEEALARRDAARDEGLEPERND